MNECVGVVHVNEHVGVTCENECVGVVHVNECVVVTCLNECVGGACVGGSRGSGVCE